MARCSRFYCRNRDLGRATPTYAQSVAEFYSGKQITLIVGASAGAPRATPPEIIGKLNVALNAGLADPKIKAQFAALGGVTAPLTASEYGNVIVSETEKWGNVIRAANIKAQ